MRVCVCRCDCTYTCICTPVCVNVCLHTCPCFSMTTSTYARVSVSAHLHAFVPSTCPGVCLCWYSCACERTCHPHVWSCLHLCTHDHPPMSPRVFSYTRECSCALLCVPLCAFPGALPCLCACFHGLLPTCAHFPECPLTCLCFYFCACPHPRHPQVRSHVCPCVCPHRSHLVPAEAKAEVVAVGQPLGGEAGSGAHPGTHAQRRELKAQHPAWQCQCQAAVVVA